MSKRMPMAERPTMKNYGISRDADGLLPWSWAEERLTHARNYWICSARPDGRPHAAPVWGVWIDDSLIFGVEPTSRKARNLQSRAEVVVHLESGDEVVIVEGKAVPLKDADLRARMSADYALKYGLDVTADASADALYLRVEPEQVMGWLEKDFPKTATRWRFG
jgi:hypothetical protein